VATLETATGSRRCRVTCALGDGLACLLGAACGEKRGAGAVNEEHADVGVALLADASESPAPSRGTLARGEPEPAGEFLPLS
jgi:hypothetical protein